jgi:hypothetical protein
MKYSQILGVFFCFLLLISSFMPWLQWPNGEFWTGLAAGKNYMAPAKLHLILAAFSLICFIMPKISFKRWNLLFIALNAAWLLRNILVLPRCDKGTFCPEFKIGFILAIISVIGIVVMALLPKLPVPIEKNK